MAVPALGFQRIQRQARLVDSEYFPEIARGPRPKAQRTRRVFDEQTVLPHDQDVRVDVGDGLIISVEKHVTPPFPMPRLRGGEQTG